MTKLKIKEAIDNDLSVFKSILQKHNILEIEELFQESIISISAKLNAKHICQYLHNKENIAVDDVYNPFNERTLEQVIMNRNEDLFQWFLEKGANPDGNYVSNSAPLFTVLYLFQRELLTLVVNEKTGKHKPANYALENSHLIQKNPNYAMYKRMFIELLDKGADPNLLLPSLCKTPLDSCHTYNLHEMSEILLKYGAVSAYESRDLNQLLNYWHSNLGKILSLNYQLLENESIVLNIALLAENTKLKVLMSNGLYAEQGSEVAMVVDTYIPIHQQLINNNNPYAFFSKIVLNIANKTAKKEIFLNEGMIFDKSSFTFEFPKDIDGLMLIRKNLSDKSLYLWVLVPFKYPKSGKFTPSTLIKFIERRRKYKWQKIAYMLKEDDDYNYLPIFE